MQLTEHFTLAELTDSDIAVRLGIDNRPREGVVERLRTTAELGELIRAALNEGRAGAEEVSVEVTSGYRCEALERVVAQKDYAAWCRRRGFELCDYTWGKYFVTKSHPWGAAMDFRAPRFGTPRQIVELIASRPEIMAKIDQIIMEGTWVHVAWSDNPRGEVKTASFDANGTPSYTKGLG